MNANLKMGLASSNQANASSPPPTDRGSIPRALRRLTRAILLYQRSGWNEEEACFKDWALRHFNRDDYARAVQATAMPPWTSAEDDYRYADSLIRKVGQQWKRLQIEDNGDMLASWQKEIKTFTLRRREKKKREQDVGLNADSDAPVGAGAHTTVVDGSFELIGRAEAVVHDHEWPTGEFLDLYERAAALKEKWKEEARMNNRLADYEDDSSDDEYGWDCLDQYRQDATPESLRPGRGSEATKDGGD